MSRARQKRRRLKGKTAGIRDNRKGNGKLGESRKRNWKGRGEKAVKAEKRRISGGDALEWLRERAVIDAEIKKEGAG